MTETIQDRAARLLAAHVRPRDRPRPPLTCGTPGCGTTAGTRPFVRGPLCPDHAPPQPTWAPSPIASPSDTMPARTYGTATTDPPRIAVDGVTVLPP